MSEGDSRVLVLQRDNFPLAWLEGSTGMTEGGSRRVLVLLRMEFSLPPPSSSPPLNSLTQAAPTSTLRPPTCCTARPQS